MKPRPQPRRLDFACSARAGHWLGTALSELASPRCLPRSGAAFSLVEVLVAVSLMAVMVIGLLAMFDQVQRAFRGSMTQTDVLASGRSLQEMIARQVEQIAPCYVSATNLVPGSRTVPLPGLNIGVQPIVGQFQSLPGGSDFRSNVLERFYFLTRENRQWRTFDYLAVPDTAYSTLGALYLYETNFPIAMVPTSPTNLWFSKTPQTLATLRPGPRRVADGIIHFAVHAYDTSGVLLLPTVNLPNVQVLPGQLGEPMYRFYSNALPATLEVEFAILEPRALERFRSLAANPAAATKFLADQAGRVHLFRQRIPLRNAETFANP